MQIVIAWLLKTSVQRHPNVGSIAEKSLGLNENIMLITNHDLF